MSSLVIQTSFLGDMVLTTPLIERLAARGPVDVVATPKNAPLLANHPAVRDVIVFDKRGHARGLSGMRRVARDIKWRTDARGVRVLRRADVAYLAQGSMRSAAIAMLAGVPERIGFSTSAARLLYTTRVRPMKGVHHALRLWQLASRDGDDLVPSTIQPSLFPGADDVAQIDALLRGYNVDASERMIALAPGSVWATKRWPSYDALAERLVATHDMHDARFVIIGGKEDAQLAAAIVERVRAHGALPAIDATGRLSLLGSAELIRRARVVVTNDSSPLHLASAMGTPTIALFGPTVTSFGFGPMAPQHRVLEIHGLGCRPCHAHGPPACPLGHWKCMRDLAPEPVAAAALEIMRARSAQ